MKQKQDRPAIVSVQGMLPGKGFDTLAHRFPKGALLQIDRLEDGSFAISFLAEAKKVPNEVDKIQYVSGIGSRDVLQNVFWFLTPRQPPDVPEEPPMPMKTEGEWEAYHKSINELESKADKSGTN